MLAPLALPVIIAVTMGFRYRWMTDDGFIYLRIVNNVVEGNGPVFNQGERVEAYTSPAWLAILSVADVLTPVRLEWLAVVLGITMGSFGLVAAMAGALRLAGWKRGEGEGRGELAIPAGALVVIAPFAMWMWQTSGLETGLTWAWLGACLLVLARWADTDRPMGIPSAVLAGLGPLVRPELAVFSALFLVIVLTGSWSVTGWRDRLKLVAAFIAVPLAYEVFRMGYFGLMVSNTAIAKEGTSMLWQRGRAYLDDFIGPYWLWFPVLVLVAAGYVPVLARGGGRQRLVVVAFGVGALITATYVVAVGGDYLHGRFFVPSLFALCAPVAAVPIRRRYAGLLLLVPWCLAAMLVLRPPQLGESLTGGVAIPKTFGQVTTDDLGWGEEDPALAWFSGADLYVESQYFNPSANRPAAFEANPSLRSPAVIASGIGVISYALGTDVHVVDTLGLADPIGSHFEVSPDQNDLAGHDKPVPGAWLVPRVAHPDARVPPDGLGVVGSGLIAPTEGEAWWQQVSDARHALACPPLVRLQAAASSHLGPRRFLRNLLSAPANTRLRIPPDPAEARAEFC